MPLSHLLKLGMRRLASGVCVITTVSDQGSRYAMTASSVTSLSDSPASLLVCIHQDASIYPLLDNGLPFAVNILGEAHQHVSNKCAERGAGVDRFQIGDWAQDQRAQLPYLVSAQVVFFCEVDGEPTVYGTHKIVVGRLTDARVPEEPIAPLIYLDGGYRQLK